MSDRRQDKFEPVSPIPLPRHKENDENDDGISGLFHEAFNKKIDTTMSCCEADGCCERTGTHCWFLWCCICSIVGISLPRLACIVDPFITIFLWCFARDADDNWASMQFSGSFGTTGVDVMVLSLIRASIQYWCFEYNRSKTVRALHIASVTFAVSVMYLLVKLLYLWANNETATVAVALFGVLISVAQIVLFLAFRRRRIKGKSIDFGLEGGSDGTRMQQLGDEYSDAEIEIGEENSQCEKSIPTPGAEAKQDHMAYVETEHTFKDGGGIEPESLKDDDSLFMDIMDVRLHYKLWRAEGMQEDSKNDTSSSAATTVLLHGFGGSTYTWREVWQPLQKGCSCVLALDMPGAGLTSRPIGAARMASNPFSQKYACQLLFAVLDKLGISSCRMVGHGMGGCLAVYAATLYPSRVSMLTLISPMVFMDPFPKLIRDVLRTSVMKELLVALVRSQIGELVLRKAWFDKRKIPKEALQHYQQLVKVRNWHAALIELSRAEPLKIGPAHLASLTCPVGIIHGEKDKIVPISNSTRLESSLQRIRGDAIEQKQGQKATSSGEGVRVCRIKRCGHVPHEELPSEFMRNYEELIRIWQRNSVERKKERESKATKHSTVV
mmetsp:Transcript_30557/g.51687  ORF Transcript_30557/g.51687 Transcript_30557/m.51687 type:complete len:610 (-) Transcript_30557:204-2033(-)